jgi:hypothetical protein
MSRVFIRSLKRQLELELPRQPIYEVIQSQELTHSQTKGIQPVNVPNNKP